MFKDLSLADLTVRTRILFSGARTTPEIVALVTPYGYDVAALDAALDLVEDVEALTTVQRAEYADQFAATGAMHTAFANLEALYTRHRSLARLKHARGSEGYQALALAGRAPENAAALDAQEKESSEAQRATTLRDDAVALLRARAADFAAIARIALAGVPQLRERLGLLERA